MYTYAIAVLMMLLSEAAFSSTGIKKEIPKFIPKGYVLFDTVFGDLNKDGLEDCVIIIKGTKKKNFVEYHDEIVDRNRRGVLVLFNKDGHYELAVKNYNCFSSENEDGGVYFPPELSLEISKGNLYFQYGHGRYGYWYYTFRYHDSDLELIGFDIGDMRGPIMETRTSINYLTKTKIVEENINEDAENEDQEVFKKTETKIKASKLYRLSTIKDIEELGNELID